MQDLQYIEMRRNEFSGPLQDRFNGPGLRNLRALALDENFFTGPIPPTLGDLDALSFLSLEFNLFEGAVPNEVCGLRTTEGSGLLDLSADCVGEPAANPCDCCSICCDPERPVGPFCDDVLRRLEERPTLAKKNKVSQTGRDRKASRPRHSLSYRSLQRERVSSQRNRKLQEPDCAARYLWDAETGDLIPL